MISAWKQKYHELHNATPNKKLIQQKEQGRYFRNGIPLNSSIIVCNNLRNALIRLITHKIERRKKLKIIFKNKIFKFQLEAANRSIRIILQQLYLSNYLLRNVHDFIHRHNTSYS